LHNFIQAGSRTPPVAGHILACAHGPRLLDITQQAQGHLRRKPDSASAATPTLDTFGVLFVILCLTLCCGCLDPKLDLAEDADDYEPLKDPLQDPLV
jgi:hypothetical protein